MNPSEIRAEYERRVGINEEIARFAWRMSAGMSLIVFSSILAGALSHDATSNRWERFVVFLACVTIYALGTAAVVSFLGFIQERGRMIRTEMLDALAPIPPSQPRPPTDWDGLGSSEVDMSEEAGRMQMQLDARTP